MEAPEIRCGNHKKVNGCNGLLMIVNERPPALSGWPVMPLEILAHCPLGYVKAQHRQFTVDTRCTPKRVIPRHSLQVPVYLSKTLSIP